jgi:hypothetical protein
MTPQDWSRIQQGIFKGESGGDYGALFGYQNRPGGKFANIDLTKMTIDDALEFANPSGNYGQFVKGQVGRVATPMGAYQVVGSTLRDAKKGLGFSGQETMSPEIQDEIGKWIYKTQGTGAWEGYKPLGEDQAIASQAMQVLGKSPKGLLAPTQTPETETKPMIQQQKPRGLLENLGIQKMEEGAEGETGQRFYQRDTFKDTAARMAPLLASMGSSPALQKATAGIAAQRTEKNARNKTIEYLRKNGREDLASAVESGALSASAAASELFKKAAATKGVAVGDKLVNPVTGEVIYQDEGQPAFEPKDVADARKEFTGRPEVKDFSKQTSAYGRVLASAKDPSAAGDLALIFNFMKVLDPGSTVREGEFATAQNAGGVDQRVVSLYNSITTGERLSPAQRDDFANRATRLYSDAEAQYDNIAQQYSTFAEQAGLPVDQVIPDFSYSGSRYESPLRFRRPPAPAGVSAEDWATSWENMSDEQRRGFLDGGD